MGLSNLSLCRHLTKSKVLELNCFPAANAIELHIFDRRCMLFSFFCPIFCQFRSICCMPQHTTHKAQVANELLQSEILAKCSLILIAATDEWR